MKFTLITAFPDFFESFLSTSIIGRAVKEGLLQVEIVDLRRFGSGSYRQIDDYAYGGGGMVLMAKPLKEAIESARSDGKPGIVVYPSPQGAILTQETVETLFARENIIIICGHYEGIDERITEKYVDLEISIGDFVVTGGEIPAMAIMDAVSRRVPGVVGKDTAVVEDSFYRGMLDHSHFTRPSVWDGREVPEVLLSGHEDNIRKWRRREASLRTLYRRPDLLARANILPYVQSSVYLTVLDGPGRQKKVEESLPENHWPDEMRKLVKTGYFFGIDRFFYCSPSGNDRAFVKRELEEMNEGSEKEKDMGQGQKAKAQVKCQPSLESSLRWIERKDKERAFTVGITGNKAEAGVHWLDLKRKMLELNRPILFVLDLTNEGKGSIRYDSLLQDVRGGSFKDDLSLPIGSRTAVIMDRFFGFR